MRIAQVAPLIESVPPKHYGGTERIVSYLTEELVRAGHDVTLFASGDSITRARLIAGCRGSLRLNKGCVDHLAHHLVMLDQVLEHAREFDVIHFHTDYLHFPVSRYLPVPHITTLHALGAAAARSRAPPQLSLKTDSAGTRSIKDSTAS